MKNKTYQNAVEHLEFSKDLYEKVMEKAPQPKRPARVASVLVAAVLITALLASSVFAVSTMFGEPPAKVEHTVPMTTLGTAPENLEDAKMLELSVSRITDKVTVHYMELDPLMAYSYFHGMIYAWRTGYQRITEDYQFEQVEMETVDLYLEKNGLTYKSRFVYLDTEEGIVTKSKYVYQKNENGEILLNLFAAPNYNWPVYLNIETGEYRDALPNWTAEDFHSAKVYAQSLKGGLFLCTLVEEEKGSHNAYFWVNADTTELIALEFPEKGMDYIYNDTLYFQNAKGHLYMMDDMFEFRLIAEYETDDCPTDGLLTIVTDDGKLGVYDMLTWETYVFPEINIQKGDLDEISGYNARRYGKNGTIAIIQTTTNWDKLQTELLQIGVMDLESGKLHLLEINNGYECNGASWLDENRIGVIYKTEDRQFFCIYEFG